jgi:hypothetical protein
MPSLVSRTEAGRVRAEFALRIVALGALVLGVLRMAGVLGGSQLAAGLPVIFATRDAARVPQSSLLNTAKRVLLSESPTTSLHLLATDVPGDSTRALLSAMQDAGVPVHWTDSTKGAATALEVSALIDPAGGVLLRAAAPSGTPLAFRDSLGLIDSVQARAGGSSMTIDRVAGSVELVSAGAVATAIAPPLPVLRRILLIANPGWEAKFTTAALEERGWKVDVRYSLGRNVTVTQGDPLIADTARYAAVVALDSSAAPHAAELRRYANTGGGVVIAGAAGTLGALKDMLPGSEGALQSGIAGAIATDQPLSGIAWRPIAADSDAVVLMRSSPVGGRATDINGRAPGAGSANVHANASTNAATIVARRFGGGRIVQIAYDALWQWRMAGPEGSVEAHRRWWSNMVGLVAFAPKTASSTFAAINLPGSAAPYADIEARLGPPTPMPSASAPQASRVPWEVLLMTVAAMALVLEWGSRRLRGAR